MKRKRKSLPPYDVADLPFDVVSDYLDVMAKSAKNKKAKKHYTEQLLLQIKRPANLWPLVRLLFPPVRATEFLAFS